MRRISSGNFLVRAAKFPASEETGYSSFDVVRQVTRVLASAVFSVLSVPSVVNAFQDLTQRTRRAQRKVERATNHESRITDFMGRTVPTFRQLIDDAIARWSKFRRALRREDQEYFDRLFRRVRSYTQAATYQASDNPMEAILLSIALDQEKRLDALERATQPPETGAGSIWSPHEKSPGSPPAGRAGTFTLNVSSEAWSPPEKCLEKFDAPQIAGENQQPDTQQRPDDQRMDSRSLPEPARDEAVADRAEPDAPPAD
jgi:hypothetical protein